MFFEDILKTIENEQEAASIREALSRNPETKKMLDSVEARVKNGDTYVEWYKKEWPKFQDAPQLREQVAAAQETIEKLNAELKAGKPAAVPPEELNMEEMTTEQFNAAVNKAVAEQVKAQGFVTQAEAQQMSEQAALKAAGAAESKVFTHGLPLVERFVLLGRKYEEDFKNPDGTPKKLDRAAFGKFIEDNRIADPDAAYEQFTRADYLDKVKADSYAQGQLKGAKDAEEAHNKQRTEEATRMLPVDMTGSATVPTVPGEVAVPVELDKVPEDYQLGRKGGFRLAAAIAEKVKADRAAGKQV